MRVVLVIYVLLISIACIHDEGHVNNAPVERGRVRIVAVSYLPEGCLGIYTGYAPGGVTDPTFEYIGKACNANQLFELLLERAGQ